MANPSSSSSSSSSQFTYSSTPSSSSSASYFPMPFHLQQPPSYSLPPQPPPPLYSYPQPLPPPSQFQRDAQQLFHRDAQTITPEALENVKAAIANSDIELNKASADSKKKSIPRRAAGLTWDDPSLADWPDNDHRLFCGDLGNEVNDDVLSKAFAKFPSFNMARVVRDKRSGKTKGYGFVSFADAADLAVVLKEMNGKYVGNRPIKLCKSKWKERTDVDAVEKQKKQSKKKSKSARVGVLHY